MKTRETTAGSMRLRVIPFVAVLCLLLLALLTAAQVAHVHPVDTDGDHCPLCVVMHAVAPMAAAPPILIQVQVDRTAPTFEVRVVSRTWSPTLFNRPPPSSVLG